MEYHNKHRSEIAVVALLKTLMLFLVFLAALHILCLYYKSACPLCMGACLGNAPDKIDEDRPAELRPLFINTGIYAFSAEYPSSGLSPLKDGIVRNDALFKPLYNSKYFDNEHLLVSNLKLTKLWTSQEWRSKVRIFADIFSVIIKKKLLNPNGKVLCIGAGKGHEVLALKELGVRNSIGIDLVASPPLVMKGDMRRQPFGKDTFDFEFSSMSDHALITSMFVAEIERTLKPGGCVAIYLKLKSPHGHKLNNLEKVDVLTGLFQNFEIVHVRDVDAFGLDTEVVFKKPVLQRLAM